MWGLCHAMLMPMQPCISSSLQWNIKKRTNRLAAWSFPCFFFKVSYCTCSFHFILFVCLFGGREGLGFPGTSFYFSSFLKGCNCWEGPRSRAPVAAEVQALLLLFWFAINSFSSLLSTGICLFCSWLMTDETRSEGPPKSNVNWSWQKILTVPFWTADTVQNGLAGGRLTTGGSSRARCPCPTKRWPPARSLVRQHPNSLPTSTPAHMGTCWAVGRLNPQAWPLPQPQRFSAHTHSYGPHLILRWGKLHSTGRSRLVKSSGPRIQLCTRMCPLHRQSWGGTQQTPATQWE